MYFFFTIIKTNPKSQKYHLYREGSKDCGEGQATGRMEPRALSEPLEGRPARDIDRGCDMSDVRPQVLLCQTNEIPALSVMVASIASMDQGDFRDED